MGQVVPSRPVLVVDDDPGVLEFLRFLLDNAGLPVVVAPSVTEGLAVLERCHPCLVLSDLQLPDGDGLVLLREVREQDPAIPFVIMTGFGTVATAVEALHWGAIDYIQKPLEPKQLELIIRRSLGTARTSARGDWQHCASRSMKAVRRAVKQVAQTPRTTALIRGESGVGKELVCRAIHGNSARAAGPFVAINCGALAESLLESELFGYESGAFSGAKREGKHGLLSAADGGTLFLDEVGEMGLGVQAKLLRFLQERSFLRVGGTQPVTVDLRVVAATNRDLEAAVAAGTFRQDLYYRLNVVEIFVPPLRERPEDVRPLARRFLREIADEMGKPGLLTFSRAAMRALLAHPWPGNVRELRNVVERAVVRAQGRQVSVRHLGLDGPATSLPALVPPAAAQARWPTLTDVERAHVERTLERCGGNKSRAAQDLGIHRTTLAKKLEGAGLAEGAR